MKKTPKIEENPVSSAPDNHRDRVTFTHIYYHFLQALLPFPEEKLTLIHQNPHIHIWPGQISRCRIHTVGPDGGFDTNQSCLCGSPCQHWLAREASPWNTSHLHLHSKRSSLGISPKCCYKYQCWQGGFTLYWNHSQWLLAFGGYIFPSLAPFFGYLSCKMSHGT